MLPARAATPPSARGEISAAAGDGGTIIRARAADMLPPEPLRRHPPGGNHPGQSQPRGRQRGNHPGQSRHLAGDVGPVSRGDGGKDNHHAAGQSRYAAICQGGNQRGGRGRRGNHPRPGTGGQSSGPEPPICCRQSRYAAIWPGMYAVSAAFFPARAGDIGPVSRGTGERIIIMLPARAADMRCRPEPLRRHLPGGNHPGPEPPICCRQSRYAAICQGGIIRARAAAGTAAGKSSGPEPLRRHLAGDVCGIGGVLIPRGPGMLAL